MSRVSWESEEGVKVLSLDFSGLENLQIVGPLRQASDELKFHPRDYAVALVDVSKVKASYTSLKLVKEASISIHGKVKKSAIIGINSSIMPFYKAYKKITGSKAKLFDCKDSAMDYLMLDEVN